MVESQNIPSLGGITGSNGTGGTSNWLRTGANAADAVAGFLNGRNIRRKLDDHDDALTDSRDARAELDNMEDSGIGTAVAVGSAGLGLGLLLSNDRNNNRDRPRRRR